MNDVNRDGRPVQAFIGGALMVIGGLIGGLSGLCTAMVMFSGLFGGSLRDYASLAALALAAGFFPILIGVGLFIGGRVLYKDAQPPPRPVLPPASFGGGDA
jgi:hypothetical protein